MASEKQDARSSGAGGAKRQGFLLRLPPALLDELRAWAGQDLRSLNGQIEFLLREAVKRRTGRSDESD
jgi:hypothetical protein